MGGRCAQACSLGHARVYAPVCAASFLPRESFAQYKHHPPGPGGVLILEDKTPWEPEEPFFYVERAQEGIRPSV